MFELIPCLVIAKGSVWLPPGNDTEVVSRNPLRVGLRFKALGAKTLYVIDLDAAHLEFSSAPAVLLGLAHAGLNLWVGGGVRSADEAQSLIAAGAQAVVVQRLAQDPQKFDQLTSSVGPDRIIVSLERGAGECASGPAPTLAPETIERAEKLGISRFIVYSAVTPGSKPRIDSALYQGLVRPSRWIGAGSGIRTSTDLLRLQRLGVNAAIVGRALYDHPFDEFWQEPTKTDAG
ncbi:MAG: HisA/HisF-related TIM barrel protein [Firmicutes bacterium]|nr:HisA/HisF-related TIM barrel protein [Bacillota bacterium]